MGPGAGELPDRRALDRGPSRRGAFAARLAPDATRGAGGRPDGAMTGLLLGIARPDPERIRRRLGRLAGGVSTGRPGSRWRWPASPGSACRGTAPSTRIRYGALLRSLLDLVREQPVLRRAARSPRRCCLPPSTRSGPPWRSSSRRRPFGLDPAGAGLFGLIGAPARSAPRWPGASPIPRSPRPVLVGGGALTLAGLRGVFGLLGGHSLVALAVGRAADRHRHQYRAHRQPDPGLRPRAGGTRADQHRVLHRDLRRGRARRLGGHPGLRGRRLAGALRGWRRLRGGGPAVVPAGARDRPRS